MFKKLSIKGFTLVELLVVVAIFSLIVGLIYGIFVSTKRVQSAEEQLVGLSQEARGGLQQMVRELRMVAALRQSPAPVTDACGFITPLIQNTDDVEFEGDVDLDGTLERVRYFRDSTGVPPLNTLNRWEYDITDVAGWKAWPGRCSTTLLSQGAGGPAGTLRETVAFGIQALNVQFYSSANVLTTDPQQLKRVAVTVTAQGNIPTQATRTITVDVEIRNLAVSGTTGDVSAPAQPTNVTAVNRRVCGYLGVTWTRGTEGDLGGHKVYYKRRNVDGSWPDEWHGVKTVGVVSSTEFSGLTPGATYLAGVSAFDTSGNETAIVTSSNTITDDLPPINVSGLTPTKNDINNTITLTWARGWDRDVDGRTADDNVNNYFVQYDLYRDESPTGPFTTLIQGAISNTTTTFTDTVPQKCQPYYYRITTTDSCSLTNTTTVVGGDPETTIIETTIEPPPTFYAGGGTIVEGKTTNRYAYFSGSTISNSLLDTLVIEQKFYNTIAACDADSPPAQKGTWTELPGGGNILTLNPANPIPPGASFTGSWDGFSATKAYRFVAYSKNRCGEYYSNPNPSYCVDTCKDSTSTTPVDLTGAGGLGDACVMNYIGDPIQALVCNRIKLFWVTKDKLGNPPANCKAYGSAAEKDFYPDKGDGGYLMYRARYENGITGMYQLLAPDYITGPIQPFYYNDNFFMGGSPECQAIDNTNCDYKTAQGRVCYRDRCSYRYALTAVDCAHNESGNPALASGIYAQQLVPPYFSPGIINAPADATAFPTTVEGTKKNKVVIFLENTAAAAAKWVAGLFQWEDVNARLTQIEIYNSVEWGTSYKTMWQAANNSSGVSNGTVVEFTNPLSLQASPILNAGETKKAKVRLTFYTTTGVAQRMDDNNETITITPYFENTSSTHTGEQASKVCRPGNWGGTLDSFSVDTLTGPSLTSVRQSPPNQTGCGGNPAFEGDCSITSSTYPPYGGKFRSFTYDNTNYYYYVDNNDVSIRAKIIPFSGSYPVDYCGDIATNKGVIIYYAITGNNITSAPIPQNDSGIEELRSPTKTNLAGVSYQKLVMCNEAVVDKCTALAGCPYLGTIPAQTGQRVWYYITAVDSTGNNYNLSPSQPGDTFTSAYSYDAKEKVFHYIWTSFSYSSATNTVTVPNLWITRINGNTGSDPLDNSVHSTKDSTLTIVVTGNDLFGVPLTETIIQTSKATTDVPACSGCWQSETGLTAAVTTANTFQSPTIVSPITVSITASKAGYPNKTCSWTITAPDMSVGGQCL